MKKVYLFCSLIISKKLLSPCIDHAVNFLGSSENSRSENSISPICHGCGKIFLWGEHLEVHQKKSGCGIEQKHECIYCDRKFKWKINLKRHIDRVHAKLFEIKLP